MLKEAFISNKRRHLQSTLHFDCITKARSDVLNDDEAPFLSALSDKRFKYKETRIHMTQAAETIYRRITTEAAAHLQIRRLIVVLLTMSVLANALLALYLLVKEDQTRTVVIAPDSLEPYIAMTDRVSPNLLERFSVSALGLVMNMSPQTGRWQTEAFLKHVAPESYAEIAAGVRRAAASLERNQASTAFFAEAVSVDDKTMTTCIAGTRKTLIGRAVTEDVPVSACLRSTVRLGRLMIVQLSLNDEPKGFKKLEAAEKTQTSREKR